MTMPLSGDTFDDRHSSLLQALRGIADPQARLAWVIDRSGRRGGADPAIRVGLNEIKGCASRLWLETAFEGGRCRFRSDSESAILKAVVGLLCELYDDLPAGQVMAGEPGFLEMTGLANQLTENRRRSLGKVREAMRAFAAERAGLDAFV
jgi:cysteine desulfuration protein SufE